MRPKAKNILGIDWWEKYVGFAYVAEDNNVIMPIWNLINDGSMFFNLGDILMRYHITKIVIGRPKREEEIQKKIENFIQSLEMIADEELTIEKYDEDYTSVEAAAKTGEFTKASKNDTLAAMVLLERRKERI